MVLNWKYSWKRCSRVWSFVYIGSCTLVVHHFVKRNISFTFIYMKIPCLEPIVHHGYIWNSFMAWLVMREATEWRFICKRTGTFLHQLSLFLGFHSFFLSFSFQLDSEDSLSGSYGIVNLIEGFKLGSQLHLAYISLHKNVLKNVC